MGGLLSLARICTAEVKDMIKLTHNSPDVIPKFIRLLGRNKQTTVEGKKKALQNKLTRNAPSVRVRPSIPLASHFPPSSLLPWMVFSRAPLTCRHVPPLSFPLIELCMAQLAAHSVLLQGAFLPERSPNSRRNDCWGTIRCEL